MDKIILILIAFLFVVIIGTVIGIVMYSRKMNAQTPNPNPNPNPNPTPEPNRIPNPPETVGAAYQWGREGTLTGYVPPLYFSKNGTMNAKFRVVFKKGNVYSSPGSIILTIIAGFEKPQIYYRFANNITTGSDEKLVLQRADSSNYDYWYDVQQVSVSNEDSFTFGETEVPI
jgi:hypothetical protein